MDAIYLITGIGFFLISIVIVERVFPKVRS